MNIDKDFQEWAEDKEGSIEFTRDMSENCWRGITKGIKSSRKWYDNFFISMYKLNRIVSMKSVVAVVAIVLAVVLVPKAIYITKEYISEAAARKNHSADDIRVPIDNKDNNGNKDNNESKQREADTEISVSEVAELINGEKDPVIREALVRVQELTKGKSEKYTVYYSIYSKLVQGQWLKTALVEIYNHSGTEDIPYVDSYSFGIKESRLDYFEHNILKYEEFGGNPSNDIPGAEEKSGDLDGDGHVEEIKIDISKTVLKVNDVAILLPEHQYHWSYSARIVDIDKADNRKEIMITTGQPNASEYSSIFYYEKGMLYKLASLEGGTIEFSGDGDIICKGIMSQFFETHSREKKYKLEGNNVLKEIPQEFYEYNHVRFSDEPNQEEYYLTVKESLQILKNKESGEEEAILKVGDKVKIVGTDYISWILVETSEGVRGWIEIIDGYTIKKLNKPSYEIFEGIYLAG